MGSGAGGFCPLRLSTFVTFSIFQLRPPDSVTYPRKQFGVVSQCGAVYTEGGRS